MTFLPLGLGVGIPAYYSDKMKNSVFLKVLSATLIIWSLTFGPLISTLFDF